MSSQTKSGLWRVCELLHSKLRKLVESHMEVVVVTKDHHRQLAIQKAQFSACMKRMHALEKRLERIVDDQCDAFLEVEERVRVLEVGMIHVNIESDDTVIS